MRNIGVIVVYDDICIKWVRIIDKDEYVLKNLYYVSREGINFEVVFLFRFF